MSSVGAHQLRVKEFLKRFDPQQRFLGVEVGVFQGEGAESLLERFPNFGLIAVDQWENTDRYAATGDPTAPLVGDACYVATVARLARFGNMLRLWRMPSLRAALLFDNADLDFAFIDAEHTHDGALEDCRAWWPKVKSGGWLCGHDYGCGIQHPHVAGVTTAVDQFAKEVGGTIETIGEAGDHTWWIRKP